MKIGDRMEYIIEEIDKYTGSWIRNTYIIDEFDILREILGDKFFIRVCIHEIFFLNFEEIHPVLENFSFDYHSDSNLFRIRKPIEYDRLSYQIHTGRELIMMNTREKPFSEFHSPIDADFDIFGGQKFEELHKKHGIFRDVMNIGEVRYNFFYIEEEKWRCDAYIILIKMREKFGVSAHTEWMEGKLLGYSDAEMGEFLEKY